MDPVESAIRSGWCVPLRRWYRRFCTVNSNHPMSKKYLKSTCQIRIEKLRHLNRYYKVIHPFSTGYLVRDFIAYLLFNIQLLMVPLLILCHGRFLTSSTFSFTFLLILDSIGLWHLSTSFRCGYFDEDQFEIILDYKAIVKRYVLAYFIFDLVAVFQLNHLAALSGLFEERLIYHVQWLFRFVRIGAIAQTPLWMRLNLPTCFTKLLGFLNVCTIIWIWTTMLIFTLHYDLKDGFSFWRIMNIHMKLLEIIFFVKAEIDHRWYDWINPFFLIIGLFFQLILVALMSQVYNWWHHRQHKELDMINQVNAYVKRKNVPQQVEERIQTFLQFKRPKLMYNEELLFSKLSKKMREEILWELYGNFFTRVKILKDLPKHIQIRLMATLKQEVYLLNDVIVQTGAEQNAIFYIFDGVVGVFQPNGEQVKYNTSIQSNQLKQQVTSIGHDDYFGGTSFFSPETAATSFVAMDLCELYILTKKAFDNVLKSYPEVLNSKELSE